MQLQSPSPADQVMAALRGQTLRTGVWPTLFVCLYSAVYVAGTWSQPHRSLITGLIVLGVVSAVAMTRLPLERVIRSRWREPFFVGYSAALIGNITTSILVDGAGASPLLPLLFLPMVYAAVSYPLLPMLLVAAIDLIAFLLVASVSDEVASTRLFVFAASLAAAGWICAWLSHNHEEHRRELERASRTDPLTGCLNRRGFAESFQAESARARRQGVDLTLVLVDLDDFKTINDAHGHAAGDELLRWVADRLHAGLRAHDVVARLGGDEFALLVDAPASTAARRVEAVLAERVSASVGTAVFPVDGGDLDELCRVADAELYDGKRTRDRAPRRETPSPA